MTASKASASTKRRQGTKSATGSRNTAAKKSTSKSRQTSKNTRKKNNKNPIRDEVIILLTLIFVIITFLSVAGWCGSAGKIIAGPLFGLFGVVAYLAPFAIGAGIMFLVVNNFSGASKVKTVAALVTTIFVSGLFQLIDGRVDYTQPVSAFYTYSHDTHFGGGFFGGLICKAFGAFGFGAIIIVIMFIIIGLVVVTEHSFINGVRKGSSRVYHSARESLESYRAETIEHQRQRENIRNNSDNNTKKVKRIEKKATGIADVTIAREEILKNVELHEITAPTERIDDYTEDILTVDGTSFENDILETFEDDITMPQQDVLEELSQEDYDYPEESYVSQEEREEPLTNENRAAKESPVKIKTEGEYTVVGQEHISPSKNKAEEDITAKMNVSVEEEAYKYPPVSLLSKPAKKAKNGNEKDNRDTAMKLQQTLANFGVKVTVTDVSCGPTVTRYELQPEQGVKVSKIVSLADDIKLNLAAADIRIEAPIPGKAAVGIEVPNKETTSVSLRELIESEEFKNHPSKICFAAGRDIAGKVIVADIAKMPHLLIAGATGSGKSVCINTIIMSILYKAKPSEVKLIMVDPKVVELSVYNGIPHLMIPVVTDCKQAAQALNWAVAEMTDRYNKFAQMGVRDLKGYNEKIEKIEVKEGEEPPKKMFQLVVIIDELADLMMVAPGEVEDAICRLAQLARAAGIHLIIATQRPSVNVITGVIKANVPSRIAFAVSSGVDSRTIIDMVGAEKLLGKGDMLFAPSGYPKPVRAQCAFVSDTEVSDVVEFLKENAADHKYSEDIQTAIKNTAAFQESQAFGGDLDSYFAEAGRFVIEKERASIGLIQRFYKVGFNRAARIMDQLADAGVVGPEEGTKPRKILMTMEEFEQYLQQNNM